MTQLNMELLRPWAATRASYRAVLTGERAQEELGDLANTHTLPLSELSSREDLFSAVVEPAWPSLSNVPPGEIADQVIDLLLQITNRNSQPASVRLYQIFFSDWAMHFGTWSAIKERLQSHPLSKNPNVFAYLQSWVEQAPDCKAVAAALYLLTYVEGQLRREVLLQLAQDYRLVIDVAVWLLRKDADVEDTVIEMARNQSGAHRMHILSHMLSHITQVNNPDNRQWLLTEGYDSGYDYHPCAVQAALLGNMLGSLRQDVLAVAMVHHHANALSLMCEAWGGSSSWMSIVDYPVVAEAIERLLFHIDLHKAAPDLLKALKQITYVLVHVDEDDFDNECPLTKEQVSAFKANIDRYFSPPLMSPQDRLDWFWWERRKPTVKTLREGELCELNSVIDQIKDSGDQAALVDYIDWATTFLALDADTKVCQKRQQELLAITMPGVCTGGLLGLTDERLHSVYGQVLLQSAQALLLFPGQGEALLRAALATDYPHLPQAALAALREWPPTLLPADLGELLN